MNRKEQLKVMATIFMKKRYLIKKMVIMFMMGHSNLQTNMNALINAGIDCFTGAQRFLACRRPIERKVWKFERKSVFWESDVLEMDETLFKNNFRVTRQSFRKICAKVGIMARRDTNMRLCIPLEKRVAIALFSLGSSAEYRTVAHLFSVGVSTACEIVLEFCHVVCNTFAEYISSYPPTIEEIERVVGGFKHLGFPQCFGAIDGCHIEIQPKKEDAVDFYNFKGWYSIILFASCDHKSKFTYINIGSSGRNNDSYVFENSSLKKFHENFEIFTQYAKSIGYVDVPVLLIGDSAFRLSRCVMKPFPFKPNQPLIEKTFNYRLSKCRRVIENAFGQLKARFRTIGRGLQVLPENCNIVLHACCLLHNFLKTEDDDVDILVGESEVTTTHNQPSSITRSGECNVQAKLIRNAIALSFQLEGGGSGEGVGDDSTVLDVDGVGEISGAVFDGEDMDGGNRPGEATGEMEVDSHSNSVAEFICDMSLRQTFESE